MIAWSVLWLTLVLASGSISPTQWPPQLQQHFNPPQCPSQIHHKPPTLPQSLSPPSAPHHSFYTLRPLTVGAEVHGVDLTAEPSAAMVREMVRDTYRHKLLVFKHQPPISAERHLAINKWFGEHMDRSHRHHPKAEHRLVFRVSNEKAHGFTNVGTYWHIDGYFFPRPHSIVTYYMPSVPSKGHTVFADLYKMVEDMDPLRRARWDRVYTTSHGRFAHPLLYTHPVTRKQTICLNTRFMSRFIEHYGSPDNVTFTPNQTAEMKKEILAEFDERAVTYAHKWEDGDFLMTDNLALAHYADPDTQLPASEIGRRVLHRVSVLGSSRPSKNPPALPDNPLETGRLSDLRQPPIPEPNAPPQPPLENFPPDKQVAHEVGDCPENEINPADKQIPRETIENDTLKDEL